MLPDANVFLDVDDLATGKGAEYVDVSCVSLIFCTRGYFESPNCMREILRAVVTRKPILPLLELETSHGGLTKEEVLDFLRDADRPCEKRKGHYSSKYEMWGLDKEVASWGYDLPSGDELYRALFASIPIEWNRIGAFQDITLRLIAEWLMPYGDALAKKQKAPARSVFVKGEFANQKPLLKPPTKPFHLCAPARVSIPGPLGSCRIGCCCC